MKMGKKIASALDRRRKSARRDTELPERVCDLCQGAGERFGVTCGKCGGSGVLVGRHHASL